MRFNAEKKVKEHYGDYCSLRYDVKDHKYSEDSNAENVELMKEALEKVGFYLSVEDGVLSLSMMSGSYATVTTRNAGRRKTFAWKNGDILRYSDIVLMMQTMTDQEISDKIHMKIATYYRHKKEMRESDYFKSLDQNKLRDEEYLKSVKGNYGF